MIPTEASSSTNDIPTAPERPCEGNRVRRERAGPVSRRQRELAAGIGRVQRQVVLLDDGCR